MSQIQLSEKTLQQINEQLSIYDEWTGKAHSIEVIPLPRPDYEAEYGGPYKCIVHAYYCERWCAIFGIRLEDDEAVLWMD